MTIWLTWGLVGFGWQRDRLFPELRLGIVAVGYCRGAIRSHVESFRTQARLALDALKP